MDDKTKEDRPDTEPKPNGQPAQATTGVVKMN